MADSSWAWFSIWIVAAGVVAEYGLALETVCEVIGEDQIVISEATYTAIERLGRTMDMAPTTWEYLHPLVAPI